MKSQLSKAALLALAVATVLTGCGKQDTTQPLRRNLVQAVYASGTVVPQGQYRLAAAVAGRVEAILAPEGTAVAAGQTVLRLVADTPDLAIAAAQERMRLAARNASPASPVLAELTQQLAVATEKLQLDSLTATRNDNLLRQNAISRMEYDRSQTQLATSRASRQAAASKLASTRLQLATELEQARIALHQAKTSRGDWELKAAAAGRVYQVLPDVGTRVTANQQVALLGDADRFYLELYVDEADINLVQPGQTVLIGLDAYPDTMFKATVRQIKPSLVEARKSFQVDADFVQQPPRLYAGASAEANIVILEKKNTLTLPIELLLPGDSAIVKTPDGPRTVHVKTGARDMERVEILGGLTETSEVLKPEKK